MRTPGTRREPDVCGRPRTKLARAQNGVTAGRDPRGMPIGVRLMKALSITQPWASLVAQGEKQFETRSWTTRYRGPLAIHAARSFPREAIDFAQALNTLTFGRLSPHHDLPRGGVIAVVKLVDVLRVEDVRDKLSREELLLGDYADGRFAWQLKLIESFDLRPALGRQGLWDWKEASQ